MSSSHRTRPWRTAVTAAVAAAALTMTGCAGGAGSSSSGGSGSLTGWVVNAGDVATYKWSAQEFAKSTKTPFKLSVLNAPDYKQKITTAVGSPNPPDIYFGWGGGILKSYVDAGHAMDLTQAVEKSGLKSRLFPSVFSPVTLGGKIYGVPISGVQPVYVYYNKKVFEEAGVQPPKTWDDLLSLVKTFNGKGVIPFAQAGAEQWTYLMWLEELSMRLGGSELAAGLAAGDPKAWADPSLVKAAQMVQDLIDAKGFDPNFSTVAYATGASSALLTSGKAAMQLMGSWDYPIMKSAAKDFVTKDLGFVTFPTVAGGKGDAGDLVGSPSTYYYVNSATKSKSAAVDYATKHVMSDAYVTQLLKNGSVPPVLGLGDKLTGQDDSDWLKFEYQTSSTAKYFGASWDQTLSPSAAQAVLDNSNKLFLKQLTPDQYSKAMVEAVGAK